MPTAAACVAARSGVRALTQDLWSHRYRSRCFPDSLRLFRFAASVTGASAMTANAAAPAATLVAKPDLYGGMIIDHEQLPNDPEAFAAALTTSLQEWSAAGVRGVWLRLPLQHSQLVPVAVQKGSFIYHHAEQDYVMLTRWLPTTPSTLPPNASHQVGVGAFVVNEKGQVLVVQENSGVLKGKGVWKMPTGLVHAGENLHEAAEREVLEETGVRARFAGLLAVRQAHGFAFGKSDLFFCCALVPEPEQHTLTPCAHEIAAVAWLDKEEYFGQNFQAGVPLYDTLRGRCQAWAEGRYTGMNGGVLSAGLFGRQRSDLLFYGEDAPNSTGSGVNGQPAAAAAAAAAQQAGGSSTQERQQAGPPMQQLPTAAL